MAKVVLLAIVGLGILIPGAHAADWKAHATQIETFELNSNRKLFIVPQGESYNSTSSLLFDAQALTPTSSFSFNGTLDYRTFNGPGETTTVNTLNNSVRAAIQKVGKLTTFNATASRSERDTSTLQLLETGQATLKGTTLVNTLSGGFKQELSPRGTLSVQTTLAETDTSKTSLESAAAGGTTRSTFTSVTQSVDLRHRASSQTVWLPSLQYQQLNFSGINPTTTEFWRATSGMETQLTRNLSLKATTGGTALSGGATTTATTTSSPRTSTSTFDYLADMVLTYKYKNGSVSFSAAHTTGPTSLGQFLKTDTASLAMSYSINQASSVTTSASFSSTTSGTAAPINFLVGSATYSYSVMRDLSVDLTYRFNRRFSDAPATALVGGVITRVDNIAQSHAVLMVVRRAVTVLP